MLKVTKNNTIQGLPEKCEGYFDNGRPFLCTSETLLKILTRGWEGPKPKKGEQVKIAFVDKLNP